MSRIVFIVLLLPLAALAKPWNGVEPGKSKGTDVVLRFGEPSKKVEARGQTVLVYTRAKAIKGTVQAQFKLNTQSQVVERIDVYPAPVIDLDAIEASYGVACAAEGPVEPCYHRRESGEKKSYLLYLKLGLAIFFKPDGRTVQSFAFLPGKS
jgi:hypothetical protein